MVMMCFKPVKSLNLVLTVSVALLLSPAAKAAVSDLEALQQANANLVFQYGFEGSDDSTRLADTSGNGYALQRRAGTDGGDVNNIQFVAGFGGVGQAYQPSYDTSDYRLGAGLNTISTAVPISDNVTVEAVFQLDSYQAVTGTTSAYILSARGNNTSTRRAYFLRQMNDGSDRVTSTLGDTFGDTPAVLNYTPGDWYYIAMVASYDSVANQTTVGWYFADLTAGDSSLAVVTDNTTFQGIWSGPGQFGVGNFLNGNQEYLQGRIDNVALTDGLLSQSDIEARLSALYVPVPEPATWGLFALAGGLLVLFRRKHQ
jgi:hypothetical protein